MRNSKYNFWTWLIAIVLAVYLLWQWSHGHGTGGCCAASVAEPASPPVVETPAPQPFQFTATAGKFDQSGDASGVSWLSQSNELIEWLKKCGSDCQASGGSQAVVLTGTVESEQIKKQLGDEAQAFFGVNVVIDNQLTVKVAEQAIVAVPPSAAKLYFDTAKTELPVDADQALAPIVEWLKANANAKAVLSGYHDSRGNRASNEQLAKNRAKAVREALKAAGIDESRIEMRKPAEVDGGADLAEARRVEVSVE